MAPQRVNSAQNHNRKRKSTNASQTTASSVESTNLDEFPAPPPSANAKPKAVPLKGVSPLHARTPIVRSPERKRVPGALSVVQKEALVENLRLEITERARKLRAQYALQAQGLRTRLEIRIHRIPASLRKMKLGELIERHAQQSRKPEGDDKGKPEQALAIASAENCDKATAPNKMAPSAPPPKQETLAPAKARTAAGRKRNSDDADKENSHAHDRSAKRLRAAAPSTASSRPAPPPSPRRNIPPSQILSPKSANARRLPTQHAASPFKPTSRPQSPQKPSHSTRAAKTSPLKTGTAPAVAAAPTASSLAKTAVRARVKASAATTTSRAPSRVAGTLRGGKKAAARTGPTIHEDEPSAGENGRNSSASNGTDESAGTVIRRGGAARGVTGRGGAAAKKTGVASRIANAGRKAVGVGKGPGTGTVGRGKAAGGAVQTAGKDKAGLASAGGKGGRNLRSRV